jgi:hypothetical protein
MKVLSGIIDSIVRLLTKACPATAGSVEGSFNEKNRYARIIALSGLLYVIRILHGGLHDRSD